MQSLREALHHRKIFSFLLLVLLTTSCGQASTQVQKDHPVQALPTPVPTLRSLAQVHSIFIGTTVSVGALQDEKQYRDVLATEFNMVTPEVSMKFDATEPKRGHYTFAEGDTLVAFAKAHSMQVRGHNLVWYLALPLRDSIWSRGIGPDYLDLAFRWAHEANPQARLFYNDYGGEGLSQKSNAIYYMVSGMIKRGVPINGVGLEMHVSVDEFPQPQDVLANMERLAALGLEVQITEMDVKIQGDPRPMQVRLDAEAQIYHDMLSACLAVEQCTAFVMWGFTDRHSWIPGATGHADAPLIFDEEYRPKPAYFALMDVLNQKKWRASNYP